MTGNRSTLCSAFLKQENTLSVPARTVYTDDIRALFATVSDLLDLKSGGESKRTLSSEEIKALDKTDLGQAIYRLRKCTVEPVTRALHRMCRHYQRSPGLSPVLLAQPGGGQGLILTRWINPSGCVLG